MLDGRAVSNPTLLLNEDDDSTENSSTDKDRDDEENDIPQGDGGEQPEARISVSERVYIDSGNNKRTHYLLCIGLMTTVEGGGDSDEDEVHSKL